MAVGAGSIRTPINEQVRSNNFLYDLCFQSTAFPGFSAIACWFIHVDFIVRTLLLNLSIDLGLILMATVMGHIYMICRKHLEYLETLY